MVKKIIFITIGCVCLLLGGIGVFIPVLPTTPFCIIAGICFSISSDRLYKWLLNSKVFGEFLRNYRDKTGIPLFYKLFSICFFWTSLGISIYFVDVLWIELLLIAVGIAVTIHLLTIKTKK